MNADPNPRELAAQLRECVRLTPSLGSVLVPHEDAEQIAAALEKGADAIDALEKIAVSTHAWESVRGGG